MRTQRLSRPSKVVLFAVGFSTFIYGSTAFAGMRCNGQLITEGDHVVKMIELCGEPDQMGQNMVYMNKDGSGMNYYIHTQANGIIDSINSSRGGLR